MKTSRWAPMLLLGALVGGATSQTADRSRAPAKSTTGALYDVFAAAKNMSGPAGEWNQVRIVTHGRRIQITMNGEQIIDYETDRSVRGYIDLQNHDSRSVVRSRNLHLTEL